MTDRRNITKKNLERILDTVKVRKDVLKTIPSEITDPTYMNLKEAVYVIGAYCNETNTHKIRQPLQFMKKHEPEEALSYINIAYYCIDFLKEFMANHQTELKEYCDKDKYDARIITNINTGINCLAGAENLSKFQDCDNKDNFESLLKVINAVLSIYETENAEKIKTRYNYTQDLKKLLMKLGR